jgi:acetyl-CoA carboxylase, biotin carboxylase subunit
LPFQLSMMNEPAFIRGEIATHTLADILSQRSEVKNS